MDGVGGGGGASVALVLKNVTGTILEGGGVGGNKGGVVGYEYFSLSLCFLFDAQDLLLSSSLRRN